MTYARTKAQHAQSYRIVPGLLREMRDGAGLTQRQLGDRLGKPHSWVYNCETANRRVDVAEFAAWCEACGVKPLDAYAKLLKMLR
jgi:transcriptional regulator with XRE-family HTH domain